MGAAAVTGMWCSWVPGHLCLLAAQPVEINRWSPNHNPSKSAGVSGTPTRRNQQVEGRLHLLISAGWGFPRRRSYNFTGPCNQDDKVYILFISIVSGGMWTFSIFQ